MATASTSGVPTEKSPGPAAPVVTSGSRMQLMAVGNRKRFKIYIIYTFIIHPLNPFYANHDLVFSSYIPLIMSLRGCNETEQGEQTKADDGSSSGSPLPVQVQLWQKRMRAAPPQAQLLHALLARVPLLQHQSNLAVREMGLRVCLCTPGRAPWCPGGFPPLVLGFLRAAKPWVCG